MKQHQESPVKLGQEGHQESPVKLGQESQHAKPRQRFRLDYRDKHDYFLIEADDYSADSGAATFFVGGTPIASVPWDLISAVVRLDGSGNTPFLTPERAANREEKKPRRGSVGP